MAIRIDTVQRFADELGKNPVVRVAKGALNKVYMDDVVIDPDVKVQRDFKFHLSPYKLPMTNQMRSGRCWIFTYTNMLKRKLMKRYNLPQTFLLSQKYIMFYDHLEKCNALLEVMYYMIHERGVPVHSLEFSSLRSGYLEDGGTWAFFTKLIHKYGIVPYEFYPDNRQSTFSTDFKDILEHQCYTQGTAIAAAKTRAEFERIKKECLQVCYNVLESFLGKPPTSFTWTYLDAKDRYHEVKKPFTPLSFVKKVITPVVNLDKFVVLINDPRNPYYRIYSVELLHNVVPDKFRDLAKVPTMVYFNVPLDIIKQAAYKSIRANIGVPFSADKTHNMFTDQSIFDTQNSWYKELLGVSFMRPRKFLFDNLTASPNHAMLFIGTNGPKGDWQVENSWGERNKDFPYLTMTDGWFDHYIGDVVVHESFLPKDIRGRYHKALKDPSKYVFYPFWDVFGSVAKHHGGQS